MNDLGIVWFQRESLKDTYKDPLEFEMRRSLKPPFYNSYTRLTMVKMPGSTV